MIRRIGFRRRRPSGAWLGKTRARVKRDRSYANNFANICMSDVAIAGGLQGYNVTLGIGTVSKTHLVDGTLFHGLTWQNPLVDGEIKITWGDAGNEQLTDVDAILVTNNDGSEAFVADWDATALAYLAVSTTYTQLLIDAFAVGQEEWCFGMYVLPTKFAVYNFATLLTGDK